MTKRTPATAVLNLIERVSAAETCEDLFGPMTGKKEAQLAKLKAGFQAMALLLHPDHAKGTKATDAMAKLTGLRATAKAKIEAGTYGKPEVKPVTIRSKHVYTNVVALAAGDICDVYNADTILDGKPRKAIIKIVRNNSDEDLVVNEAKILKQFASTPDDDEKKVFIKYLPRLVETTRLQIGGIYRPANILTKREGYRPITDLKAAFPDGLDARDVAWIWRRMLECLVWTHRQGIVHGAIVPPHILVNLERHGGNLIDWSYAVDINKNPVGHVTAICKDYEDYYPPEVFEKSPVTPALDLYMLTKCMLFLHAEIPEPIVRLIRACLIPNPARRYTKAEEVYKEYDSILKRLYGPPKFRELRLP